jgi:FkbM family methyltransferase
MRSRSVPAGGWRHFGDVVQRSFIPVGRAYLRHAPTRRGKSRLARRLFPQMQGAQWSTVAKSSWGGTFDLDLEDGLQRYIYCFGVWEPGITRTVAALLRPDDVFIDVGANVGYFSVLAATRVGNGGRVVAIEPAPSIRSKLLRNIALSVCDNVEIVEAGAGARESIATLNIGHATHLAQTSMLPISGSSASVDVRVAPLPDLIPPGLLARTRVIKIDVEGVEHEVLDGLHTRIDELPRDAAILLEVSPSRLASVGRSASEVFSLLKSWGFDAFIVPNKYHPSFYVTPEAHYPRRLWPTEQIDTMVDVAFARGDTIAVLESLTARA